MKCLLGNNFTTLELARKLPFGNLLPIQDLSKYVTIALLGLTASAHPIVLCLLEGVIGGRNGEEGWTGVTEYVRPSHQISCIHCTSSHCASSTPDRNNWGRGVLDLETEPGRHVGAYPRKEGETRWLS